MRNQKGFSAIEAVLILVIAGIVVVAGWYVVRMRIKVPAKTSTHSTSQNTPTTNNQDTKSAAPISTAPASYLVIKEWGVKIKMKDADKMTYVYDASQKGHEGMHDGIIDSTIGLLVKTEFVTNKTCEVSVGYMRYSSLSDDFYKELGHRIGDFYYIGTGSPYNCGNEADNTLMRSIRSDFGNIEAL